MSIQSAYTLTPNEIYASLANLIISQQVFADNFGKHQTLVDKARVDGSLYGDRKLYYAVDILSTNAWGNDSEAGNLLSLDRAHDPEVQAIVLDQARQIRLTTDQYLSKRAWGNEGAFQSFTDVLMGLMVETKKVFFGTTYNVFIGCHVSSGSKQQKTITLTGTNDAQAIAKGIADILVEMGDYSRDFNDYGYMRSYADSDIKVIWSSAFVNKITKLDTPTIFHRDGLVDKLDQDILPAKYFGRAVASSDKGSGKVIDANGAYDPTKGTLRAAHEMKKAMAGVSATVTHLFAGEEIPSGTTIGTSAQLAESDVYVEDATVICKIVTVLPPVLSGFEVGTSWFNARSLTTNNYITFMYNSLASLKNYPFITVKKA